MSPNTVLEKYAQPEVIGCWQDLSRQGLQFSEREMAARYLPPPPAGPLLDAGCGAGRAALALERLGYRATGVDLSLPMLRAGRSLSAAARFAGANILALPFPNDTFQASLMFFGALQHIPGRDRRRQALAELARVTCPRGRLVAGLDNLAPALVCYAYWLGRRALPTAGPPAAGSRRTAADTALWSRQARRTHPLVWHARGLARSLRWRAWPGLLDLARRVAPGSAQPGDIQVAQFSLLTTPGRIYYHIYRADELVEEAEAAGWRLLGHHSGAELSEGRVYPSPVRRGDKQQFFAFEKVS